MKQATLAKISYAIGHKHYREAAGLVDLALLNEPAPSWHASLGRLSLFLRDPARDPFAAIITRGNGKLPFLAFSALPGATCPGAGDCLSWCYSFKAWRYPAAFARQAQNTVLVHEQSAHVPAALDDLAHPLDGPVDFRLYVDGDFDSVETVAFWFGVLADRLHIIAYGYSKSVCELLSFRFAWPENYRLNLSSGHNASAEQIARLERSPGVRGYFVAVNLGKGVKAADHGDKTHQALLRDTYMQATGRKAFPCPGKCGNCTPRGHACGSSRFNGIDIIIAAH